MKHRILSLVVAIILCLGVCPVQALMAAEGDVPPVADSGLAQEEVQGIPRKAAARVSASDVNTQHDNFLFANGIPIVIREVDGTTNVYSEDGTLLCKNVSDWSIYGGWFDGDAVHTADTSIVMESGTVKELFGGSFSGTLNGDTTITVESGTITNALCGGGNSSTLNGNTNVTVNNTTVDYLYGGGFWATVNGSTTVVINDGTTVTWNAFGGSNGASVKSSKMVLNGGSASQILGGGYGKNGSVANSCVELNGGSYNAVYGGGMDGGEIAESTAVTVNGGEVESVYGGGCNGAVSGSTAVTVNCDVTGSVYGGGQGAAINGDTNVEVNGGTMNFVYGGGDNGAVTGSASVTVNDGAQIEFAVYGGSYFSTVENTKVVLNGGAAAGIYGGGSGDGSVTNACVELKGGSCYATYGGGQSGCNVERATVILGVDWDEKIYAGGEKNDPNNNETGMSEIIVQNYKPVSRPSNLTIMSSTEKDSRLIIRENTGGPYNEANPDNFSLVPEHFKNIVVEYGTVTLLGKEGENLTLNSLDIQANGHVRFQDWDTVAIQKLSGNGGQLLFPAQFTTAGDIVNKPVTVGEISAAAPLIIKIEGTGWTEEELEQHYFFRGSGIDALTSTNCFFSENYDVLLQEIPDEGGAKGIYLQPKKAEESVYISKLEFNENPVTYNDTISLTVGVGKQLATVDRLELIPNARIQIRGSNSSDVLFADIQVSSDGKTATVIGMDGVTRPAQVDGGYITIVLPVDAALLNTCKEGLYMLATAPNQYSSTAQLLGPNGEREIEITPAPIILSETVSEPAFQDPLESDLEDGAFYTASVQWYPADGGAASAFQLNREYHADVILIPKEGHWLSAASIGNTVEYNGKSVACVFNSDGTVTLENLKSARFEGRTVTVAASPAEGGTVTGGGVYAHGTNATVTATPAQGWKFTGWKENGVTVSEEPAYTFTATANRTLTAHFEQEQTEEPTEVRTDALTTVPDGLKGLFNTVEEIKAVLRQKVEAAISEVGDSLVVYDVRLVYEDDGREVEPGNFPKEGIYATLAYPTGTNGTDYIFTVQHMISYGPDAGKVETLTYTAEPTGLKCHFSSLSPVAIGWQKKTTPTPDPTPEPTTPTGGSSASDFGEDSDRDDFWQEVLRQIEQAKPGDTLRINAKDRDKMPRKVMNALKKSDGITLVIRWSGGEDIVLSSDQAISEARRFYYPLSYLEAYDFGAAADPDGPKDGPGQPEDDSVNQNPATGGGEASLMAEAPVQSGGGALPAALLLSAAAGSVIWVCKRKSSRP